MRISPLLALAPGPGLLPETLWDAIVVAAYAGVARVVAATAAPTAAAAAMSLEMIFTPCHLPIALIGRGEPCHLALKQT